jgi:Isopentenyldiphosphate isomerase
MLEQYPYRLPVSPQGELVELTDRNDRPLLVAPRKGVRRLGLIRRVVLVALRDAAHRIYIQQRGPHCDAMPGYWDLSATGHIQAGESREDAARRELEEEIGVARVRIIRVLEKAPDEESDVFSTLFLAGPTGDIPVPNPEEVSDGMFLDEDELRALAAYTPDRITPALRWAIGTGRLFPARR